MATTQKDNPGRRLRRVMRELGWNRVRLARAMGVDPSTVTKLLNDRTGRRRLGARYAFRLQDGAGYCARWLMFGEGPVHMSEPLLDGMPEKLRAEHLRHMHVTLSIFREATEQ